VLGLYVNQLQWHGWALGLAQVAVFYNLYQAVREPQIFYLLMHLLLGLGYAGLVFIYLDVDIFAFIL
jgi:hypothetical protein